MRNGSKSINRHKSSYIMSQTTVTDRLLDLPRVKKHLTYVATLNTDAIYIHTYKVKHNELAIEKL